MKKWARKGSKSRREWRRRRGSGRSRGGAGCLEGGAGRAGGREGKIRKAKKSPVPLCFVVSPFQGLIKNLSSPRAMLWAITWRPFGAGEVGWGEEVGAEGIEVEGGGVS